MPVTRLYELKPRAPFPGFQGRFVHSATMTFVHWTIDAGAVLPEHSHPHEQVAHVIEGEFELTIDADTHLLQSGCVAVIPSGSIHSGRALTNCRIIDAFHPVRDDYLRQDESG
jgi:quercetin dioxygenase-like cupin family protein